MALALFWTQDGWPNHHGAEGEGHARQPSQCLLLISEKENPFWLSERVKFPQVKKTIPETQTVRR